MKIEINNLPDCQKEIFIEVSTEEFNPFFENATSKIRQNLQIDGFRKGQVPDAVAKNYIKDEHVLELAAEEAIKYFYFKAITQNDIETLGGPEINITKLAKGNPLEFKAKVFIIPEVKLPDYKKIAGQFKKENVTVEDREINETINWLRRSRSETTPKNGPAQIGDFVEITHSSPTVNGGQENQEQFVIGQSHLLPDFEKELVGLTAGQQKEFTIKFPSDYFNKELADKEAKFKVNINKVHSVKMPEITDEWAKSLGKFENLEQLKTGIKEGISKEKEAAESQKLQAQILDKISQEIECDIPTVLLEAEKRRAIEDFKHRIPGMLKMTFEDYLKQAKLTNQEFENSLTPDIKDKIKKSLILTAIKKQENITADEVEIQKETNKILEGFKNEEEAKNSVDPEHLRDYTKERIENKKALELLENLAK